MFILGYTPFLPQNSQNAVHLTTNERFSYCKKCVKMGVNPKTHFMAISSHWIVSTQQSQLMAKIQTMVAKHSGNKRKAPIKVMQHLGSKKKKKKFKDNIVIGLGVFLDEILPQNRLF